MSVMLPELAKFISDQSWTFAKTYAKTWPHEYIVEERVDGDLFCSLAAYIDQNGYQESFYEHPQIYLDHEGYTYWHMGNILNRCPSTETYHAREKEGRLPREE